MNPPDGRSPMARASEMATRIMTISLEMVLPGLAGYWLDQKFGTVALFMFVGFALGCMAAIFHLVHLTRSSDEQKKSNESTDKS